MVESQVPAVRKRGRPTAAERRAREAQILAAALGVFLQSGFGNSTIDELAAAAKVTKRTLYAYFGDKADLFAAMVTDLAVTVSLDAATDHGTLASLASRIVYRVHSDELVGLHRLVIAESSRFPELRLNPALARRCAAHRAAHGAHPRRARPGAGLPGRATVLPPPRREPPPTPAWPRPRTHDHAGRVAREHLAGHPRPVRLAAPACMPQASGHRARPTSQSRPRPREKAKCATHSPPVI